MERRARGWTQVCEIKWWAKHHPAHKTGAWGRGAALKHFVKGYCHTDLGALGASGCIRELQQVLKTTSRSQRACCSESKELKLLTAGHKPQQTPTNWYLWVKLQVWFYSDKLGSTCEDVLLMQHHSVRFSPYMSCCRWYCSTMTYVQGETF